MEGNKPLVVITGITGYVGSQVCLHFLKHGGFKVRGTVRSTKNPAKLEPLVKAFGAHYAELELVEADLLDEESIHRAIEGCKYVVHTASPFPVAEPKHEDELIKPAVEGTLAAMRGALKHGVTRVVITSSVVSIYKNKDAKKTHFSVEDWTDLTLKSNSAYEKSKTMAEKAGWDFLAALPENERFEFVTINPGLVLGPNLNECNFSSGDIIKRLMTGAMPGIPKLAFPVVDVRDVANAHLQAILRPEAANQRFMLVADTVWFGDIGDWLFEKWGK